MEPITDEDYTCEKSFGKNFEIKKLGECHDLYVQSDTLVIANVFSNIRNECLEIRLERRLNVFCRSTIPQKQFIIKSSSSSSWSSSKELSKIISINWYWNGTSGTKGKIMLKKSKKNQNQFKSDLTKIRRVKNKSNKQESALTQYWNAL